ncbi:MAG: Hpt domain-containing protein [Candidatus Latescibacterota bacterium]|nr:MAG: Hpt domain-containing protein [Candidatus Latescibacterota bacterium]
MNKFPIDRKALALLHELGGDEFLAEMIDRSSKNISQQLAEARRGLLAGDVGTARLALHAVVGSAGILGAVEIMELARAGLAALHEGVHPLERIRPNESVPGNALELLDKIENVWAHTRTRLEKERHGFEIENRSGGGQRG